MFGKRRARALSLELGKEQRPNARERRKSSLTRLTSLSSRQSQLFFLASGVRERSVNLQGKEKALWADCWAELLDWDFHWFHGDFLLWKYHLVNMSVGAVWSNQNLVRNQPLTFEFIEISVQKSNPDRSRVSLEKGVLNLKPVSCSPLRWKQENL